MTGTGVRSTRQRAAISELLEEIDDFRSAQELHDELRRRAQNIGLTTVYRTLQSMSTAGWSTRCAPIPVNRFIDAARHTTTITWCAVAADPPSRWPAARWRPGPAR